MPGEVTRLCWRGDPRRIIPGICLLVLLLAASLSGACANPEKQLFLGATTSQQDTGLLDEIVQAFEEETGYQVRPLVLGSAQVLELARRGEIDVLITHYPAEEHRVLAEGHVLDRHPVMENSFLLVGPPSDPAGAQQASRLSEALSRIASGGHTFISRDDRSGTNARELAAWQQAGIDPRGQKWYRVSSSGQGQSLLMASDAQGYTLVDSGTFALFESQVGLRKMLFDQESRNQYSVMMVNPERHNRVNIAAAKAFADFVTSSSGQQLIAGFGRDKYGASLFTPAGSTPAVGPGGQHGNP